VSYARMETSLTCMSSVRIPFSKTLHAIDLRWVIDWPTGCE
jgi:hypothetical protein